MTADEARAYVVEETGKWFDPDVVDAFVAWLGDERRRTDNVRERKVALSAVRVGMRTSRDLVGDNGVLILARGQQITDALLGRLVKLQEATENPMIVHVEENQ